MSDEKSGLHDGFEGERQEAHDEASALVQGSNSRHVEVCSQTSQDEARDSERPAPSLQFPTHETAYDFEKSSPGPQPPPRVEAKDAAEKPSLGPQPPTHEEAHDFLERPSPCSQPPVHEGAHSSEKSSHSSQPPAHEQEQQASVKGPPITKRKIRPRQRDEETRRLENERRLEGQRLEYERKIEARKKAEEAVAVARAQSEGDEHSTNGGELSQRLYDSGEALRVRQRRQPQNSFTEESVKAECREDAEGGSPMISIKMVDDQKVHNGDDAESVGSPGPRVQEHETGATRLAIADNEHSELHLIMMAHSPSTMSLAPLLPPITPHDPSDPVSSHPSLVYCHHGKVSVARQCQCGLVREDLREDSQTGMESNYLFDPPFLRLSSPKPVESVQTRQDATDVLFHSSLGRSGDSSSTGAAVTVIIPRVKAEYYIRNNGLFTTRNTTHDFQRGGHATGREGYGGFRSRGRGGRGPRDEMP